MSVHRDWVSRPPCASSHAAKTLRGRRPTDRLHIALHFGFGSSSAVVRRPSDGSLSPDSFRARWITVAAESGQQQTSRPLPSAQTIGVVSSESCHRHVPKVLVSRRRRQHDRHGYARRLTSGKSPGATARRMSMRDGSWIAVAGLSAGDGVLDTPPDRVAARRFAPCARLATIANPDTPKRTSR